MSKAITGRALLIATAPNSHSKAEIEWAAGVLADECLRLIAVMRSINDVALTVLLDTPSAAASFQVRVRELSADKEVS